MTKKNINISNWSIWMLQKDRPRWHQCYAMGNWDNEYIPTLQCGNFFHLVMEHFNLSGEDRVDRYLDIFMKEMEANNVSEEIKIKAATEYINLCDNAKRDLPDREEKAEANYVFDIGEGFNFKCKIDWVTGDVITDYKGVKAFTSPEGQGERGPDKYKQQMWLYMWAHYKMTGEHANARIVEVSKSKHSWKMVKKDEIITACEETIDRPLSDAEKKFTKDKLIEEFKPQPKKGCKIQILQYNFTDEVIPFAEKLIAGAKYNARELLNTKPEFII